MSGSFGEPHAEPGVSSEMNQALDFSAEEFDRRRALLTEGMAAERLDGFLINSEANHRYFSGHWTDRWNVRTRPVFLVLRAEGNPVIVCSLLEEGMARQTAVECEIRTYGGSGYDLSEPLAKLVDTLRDLGLSGGRLGAELGVHMRPQIAPMGLDMLRQRLPELALVDGSAVLWRIRARKSPMELKYLRIATEITDAMYADLPQWLGHTCTERDAYLRIEREILSHGAERVGYINVQSDVSGLTTGGFTQRAFQRGKAVYFDAGCLFKGYWSDFSRIYAFGSVGPDIQDAYQRLWELTETCLNAMRPGVPIRDVCASAHEKARDLTAGQSTPFLGRVGHSIGLEMPEPPSICLEEETVIEPGMVFCVEPSLNVPGYGSLIGEETIVMTETGFELLTRRAPESIRTI